MRTTRIIGFGVGLSLSVAACGPAGNDSAPVPEQPATEVGSPVGAVWKWTGMRGGDPAMVPHPSRYTLEFFADGRYSVRADCNSGAGSWTLEAGALRMTGGPMTLASCGPERAAERQHRHPLSSSISAMRCSRS